MSRYSISARRAKADPSGGVKDITPQTLPLSGTRPDRPKCPILQLFKKLTILVDPEDDFDPMNIAIHGITPEARRRQAQYESGLPSDRCRTFRCSGRAPHSL
jgi:hypothetical protein